MSRDYDEDCRTCKGRARRGYIDENKYLIQCLEKGCGDCYVEIHIFKKIKTKGITEKHWSDATKEIYDKLNEKESKQYD